MDKIVVTYNNADLDCVASAYSYAEYLNKTGVVASYYINGIVQNEVKIVCEMFNILLSNKVKKIGDEDIIVVDTNTLSSINYVKPQNIVEFIDHHPDSGDIKFCKKASLKLYDVGAVCTVIAERFRDNMVDISRESAILLYYGIVSNTINLKSSVTTERDVSILSWLKDKCNEINELLVMRIFREKSKFNIKYLRRFMEVEEKFILDSCDVIIGQLEIADALEFLHRYKSNIDDIIMDVYDECKVKYVFINIVDILDGYHLIYAFDRRSILFLEKNLGVQFNGGIYKENKIVLRKELKKWLINCDVKS